MANSTFDFQPSLAYAPKTVHSQTLTGTSSTLTFAVPAGVNSLDVYLSAIAASGTTDFVTIEFNGDTGANYLSAYGREGNISTFESTSSARIAVAGDSANTSDLASGVIHLTNLDNGYNASAVYSGSYYDGTDENYVDLSARWNNTANVTTVTLTVAAGFGAGTSIVVVNPAQTTLAELKNNSFAVVHDEKITATTSSISFNVPDGATDLDVYVTAQTVGSLDYITLSLNGDTGANYQSSFGRLGTVTAFESTTSPRIAVANGNATVADFASGIIHLQNLSSGVYATASYTGTFNDGTNNNSAILGAQWNNTAGVTTVTLTLANGFTAGSRVFVVNPRAVGGARYLGDLGDVNSTTPNDGDLLSWSAGANAWGPSAYTSPTIYEDTLAASSGSLTFSVPSANAELDVYISAQSTGAADYIQLQFNGDTGGTGNYEDSYNRLGAVTDFNSAATNNIAVMGDSANGFSNGVIHLQNLQNATGATASYTGAFHDGTQVENIVMGVRWKTLNAVTSVTLVPASGSFAAGTTIKVVDPTKQGIGVLASVKKNYIIGSNDFGNRQIWESQGSSQLTPTTEKAPTGEMAWKYSITSTTNRALMQAMEFYGTSTWTLSMWIKALRVDTLRLAIMGQGTDIAIDPANGWQRISFSATVSPTSSDTIQFYENAASPSVGDVAYVASIQLEPGSAVTDYQSTSMGALSGSGGLSSSLYDSNGDGIVDAAQSVASYNLGTVTVASGTTKYVKLASYEFDTINTKHQSTLNIQALAESSAVSGGYKVGSDITLDVQFLFNANGGSDLVGTPTLRGVDKLWTSLGQPAISIQDIHLVSVLGTNKTTMELWAGITQSGIIATWYYDIAVNVISEYSEASVVTYYNSTTTTTSASLPTGTSWQGSYYDFITNKVDIHGQLQVHSSDGIAGDTTVGYLRLTAEPTLAAGPDIILWNSGTPQGGLRQNGSNQLLWNSTGVEVTNQLTVDKVGTTSTIYFPPQTNDPGYIIHYENNNQSYMRFQVSDDAVDTDYFEWGSSPGGTWNQAMKLGAGGTLTVGGNITENGTALPNKYQGIPALVSTGGSGTVWQYVGTLPTSNSSTMDVMYLEVSGGTWTDAPSTLYAVLRNRNSFQARYWRAGFSAQTNIQAYSQTDGSVDVYVVTKPSYRVGAVTGYQYRDSNQSNVRLININTVGSATTTTPAGTLVYDTSGSNPPDATIAAGTIEAVSALVLPVV